MKTVKYLGLAMIFVALTARGQYQKVPIDNQSAKAHQMTLNVKRSALMTVNTVQQSNRVQNLPEWNTNLVSYAKIHELPENVKKEIADKTMQKIRDLKGYYPDETQSQSPATNFQMGSNFQANLFNGLTPPDNSMAISNGGYIVSVVNSLIEYYDMGGNLLYSSSFANFFNDPTLTGLLYDPVVLYDSGSDRFFMVILSTTHSTTSQVVCCFSQSNNPNDGWWVYKLPGNALSDGSWFDYPKIGVSNNEVYVTGNLFHDNDTYNQSIIYQMTKSPGYSGGTLNYIYWYNITDNPFTIVPASYGQAGNYGPGIYLVSTYENGAADKYYFFNLTDDMTGSPSLNAYSIDANFSLGGDALQSGSSVVMNTNDNRALNAFYLNGIVHFVFHSMRSNNYNGINYNRLDVGALTFTNQIFGLDGYDYCFPSLASYGVDVNDKSVVISFLRSGSTIFPECRAVMVDDAFTWSGSAQVKTGETYVDVYQSGGITRWGDYSGAARKQSAATPEVWVSGCYGAYQSSQYALNSWVAQFNDGTTGISSIKPATGFAKVYPNPSFDLVNVEFTMDQKAIVEISLVDVSGHLVKLLLKDNADEGKNLFSFNKGVLASGIYFLKINSGNTTLANEKIIIE